MMEAKSKDRLEPARDLNVGEVAGRTGVAVSALHFYERRGLIHSHRTRGNQRRYPREVLRRVSVIKTAQSLGLSLDRIADALSVLPADRAPNKADWKRMASLWRSDLNDRIVRLLLLREMLTGCIGCGCLSTEICPLRNAGDRMAADGPGPHYLDPNRFRADIDRLLDGIEALIAEMGRPNRTG